MLVREVLDLQICIVEFLKENLNNHFQSYYYRLFNDPNRFLKYNHNNDFDIKLISLELSIAKTNFKE